MNICPACRAMPNHGAAYCDRDDCPSMPLDNLQLWLDYHSYRERYSQSTSSPILSFEDWKTQVHHPVEFSPAN